MSAVSAVVVTGGSKGIGRAIVERALATSGSDTHVLLCARDLGRGQAARAAILAATPAHEARLHVLQLDVEDAASVAAAAASVERTYGALAGLCNNAGVAGGATAEVLATNLYGVKRVSDAFLPLLRKAGPGARLVHVSSGVAPNFVAACGPSRRAELTSPSVTWAEVDAAARAYLAAEAGAGGDAAAEAAALVAAGFPAKAGGGSLGPYGLSKALLNALTLQQARDEKEAGSGVVVAACSPGFIATDLTRSFFSTGGQTPESAGALPPADGAVAPCHLLFAPGVVSGWFYGSDAKRSPLDVYRSPGSPAYEGP